MKVYEAVNSAVAAEGAEYLFAVMGDANQNLIVDLADKHGLKFVHAHHEGSAVGMADGYARFSGKLGLASVTQGPGYTNATTSLVSARLHRTPLLLLADQASLRDPYNPQGMVDQPGLAKLTTGATVRLEDAKNVDYCLGEAFRQLRSTQGPFILNLPGDIQNTEMPQTDWTYQPMYKPDTLQPGREEDLIEAARLLTGAHADDDFSFSGITYPKAWFAGLAARMRGDAATAQTAFATARLAQEQAVAIDPADGRPLSLLALIDAGLGRKEDAVMEPASG